MDRSVPCSVIFRRVSSCSRYEQRQRITARHYAGNDRPWTLSHENFVFYEFPTFGVHRTPSNGRQKTVRARGVKGHKENKTF